MIVSRRLVGAALLAALLQACGSAPTQPPLQEALQTYEERARGRFETGDLSGAAHNFDRAVTLAEMAANQDAVIVNLLNLGGTLTLLGEYSQAEPVYRRAEKEAVLQVKPEWEIRALSGLAELAYRRGDDAEAQNRYRAILQHPAASRHIAVRGTALNGLALLALRANRLEEADSALQQAEALLASLSASGRSATYLNRALLELKRTNHRRAFNAAETALSIDREAGYTPGIAADLDLLGQIRQAMGDGEESRLYYRQALNLYEQMGQGVAAKRLQVLLNSLSP